MQRTRKDLIDQARALTAANGLTGFTVEELCDQVGISRRTFFNYFATKEDAVIGDTPDFLTDAKRVAFVARGKNSPAGLSPTLLHDMIELVAEYTRTYPVTRADYLMFRDIIRAEPQLMPRLLAANHLQLERLAEAITEREGLTAADPMPRVLASVMQGLLVRTADEYLSDDNTMTFGELLARNAAFAAELFAQDFNQTGRP